MLTVCVHCNYVIEISLFNEHLLNKCVKKSIYKECDSCGLAAPAKKLKTH